MIHYVAVERFAKFTIKKALGAGWLSADHIRFLSYERLFRDQRAPVGAYIFTDFDRLTRYELECAAAIWMRLSQVDGMGPLLNAPHRVRERVALLRVLQAAGINDFGVWRIGEGEIPDRYPVFLRSEDDATGPETDLLHDRDALIRALAGHAAAGKPLRGRIAVEYRAEPGPDGYFRKYGAFRIGPAILPHHVHFSEHWVVKAASARRDGVGEDPSKLRLSSHEDEERAYVSSNPHEALLRRIFDLAGIDYGRIDYGVVGGRLQVYEINTNPTLPGSGRAGAAPHRTLTRDRLAAAFHALNPEGPAPVGEVAVPLVRPQRQDLRPPKEDADG